jgi:hypothetical protein
MDEGGTKRQRKKPLNLDGQQWEQVRVFVEEFFEQQPQKASKATYRSLFQEIQARYPCIILSKSSFQKHVALIETLRANAGISGKVEITRKYFQRVLEIFEGNFCPSTNSNLFTRVFLMKLSSPAAGRAAGAARRLTCLEGLVHQLFIGVRNRDVFGV